jgi:hypothetical protein
MIATGDATASTTASTAAGPAVASDAQGRTPRCILINGDSAIAWTSWTLEHTGIYEAGKVHIVVPATYAKWPWWTQQTEVIIDFYVGFPSDPDHFTKADLTLLMSARIDSLSLDPATGTITLTGRDLTALFTDKKIDANFRNLTASQVIENMVAQFPALKPQVSPTTSKIGTYYDADKVQLHRQVSMWTLMTYLAQREGMQCFVLGKTLYFGKFNSAAIGSATSGAPYVIGFDPPTRDRPYPVANVTKLSFSHNLSIAGGVTVRVRSYHGAQNRVSTGFAPATMPKQVVEKGAKPTQSKLSHDYIFPDLTDDQCQAKAKEILDQIGKHELKMDATAPGDLFLFPWTPVKVGGTGTLFDTTYSVVKISRSFDSRGYTMTMSCQTDPAAETVQLT